MADLTVNMYNGCSRNVPQDSSHYHNGAESVMIERQQLYPASSRRLLKFPCRKAGAFAPAFLPQIFRDAASYLPALNFTLGPF